MKRRAHRALTIAGLVLVAGALLVPLVGGPAQASSTVVGSGSSFAGIEFQEWAKSVGSPPYSLSVNYQSSSSGQGRQNFYDHTVDFAVTDIRYNKYDSKTPDPSTFEYVPVTAGGLAFMYNLKGFTPRTKPVQLSSRTVCGIFTGAIPYWDDQALKADNPGVSLPHVRVTPVVRSDPAGTNYVLEEYCLQLQHDQYASFAQAVSKATSTDYPANEPTSNWPILSPLVGAQGSEGASATVAGTNNNGYITAVEPAYAERSSPAMPVAAVQNDTGAYVLPTPKAVAKALSFATQRDDGTHVLNFSPHDAAAYNPSTYSYLLVPLKGIDPSKGKSLTTFAEYCLTIGESHAESLSYASIGRSLILYGLDRLKLVPGYVPPTSQMNSAIPAVDAVPSSTNAAAGGNAPSSGTAGSGSAGTGAVSGGTTTGGAAVASSGITPSALIAGAGNNSSGTAGAIAGGGTGSTTGSGVEAAATLDSGKPAVLGRTGIEADLVGSVGSALLVIGEIGRRRARRRAR